MGAFDGIRNFWRGYDVDAVKRKDEETKRRLQPLYQKAAQRARSQYQSGQIDRRELNRRTRNIVDQTAERPTLDNLTAGILPIANAASNNKVIRPALSGLASWSPTNWGGELVANVGRATQAGGWNQGKYLAQAGDKVAGYSKADPTGSFANRGFGDSLISGGITLAGDVANSMNPLTRAAVTSRYFTSSANDLSRGMESAGYNPQQSYFAGATLGAINAGLERTGLDKITGKVASKGITGAIRKAGISALTEGSTEAAQQFAENASRRATISSDQNLFQGVLESAGAGAILGGAASGAFDIATNPQVQSDIKDTGVKAKAKTPSLGATTERVKTDPLYRQLNERVTKAVNNMSTATGKLKENYRQEAVELIRQRNARVAELTQGGFIAGPKAFDFDEQQKAGRVFEGVDGKPRFEVDDSGAKVNIGAVYDNGYNANLDQVLDHPTLFKNYPKLKEVKVTVDAMDNSTNAVFDDKTNTITLNENQLESMDVKGTILHELQHSIQEREGFARGGSVGLDSEKAYNDMLFDKQRKLRNEYDKNPTPELREQIRAVNQEINDSVNNSKDNTAKGYRNLAGEAEARAVASRMNMSDGERYKLPKTADDYAMSHRPDPEGATLDDISQGGEFVPEDVYTNPEWYGDVSDQATRESIATIQKVRGNPEAEVTVYRASPKNELNSGDWISLSKKYAVGESAVEGTKVHSFKVKAKELRWPGDSFNEFGYFPDNKPQSTFYDSLDVPKEDLIIRDGGGKAMSVDPLESLKQEPKTIKTRTIKTADGKTEYVASFGNEVKDRVGRVTGFKDEVVSPNFKTEAEMNRWIRNNNDPEILKKEARIKEIQNKFAKTGKITGKEWNENNRLGTELRQMYDAPATQSQPQTPQTPKRSQLSGKALSTPSQEIGRALGMSDQQMQDAVNTRDNLEQSNPEKVKNLESRYLTTRLNQLDSQTTSSKTTGIDTGNTSTNLQEQDIRAIPYDRSIAQSINEQVNHPQLPKNKRVNVVDYFRTPQKVLEKIGLADSGKALVEADRAYKKELPQQIERITNWNERIGQDSEASTRIFKYLDGQKGAKKNLRGNELEVANEMKQYLADWADRLKLPKDNRVTNYITHIFEDQLLQKDFDPDLAKLIDDKVPGSVYDPFTQQRLGKQGYVEDVIRALDAYTKRAVRKANMDPALEILNNQAEALDLESWKYVKKLGDKINMRPTETDNLIDNLIKDSTPIGYRFGQRPFSRAAQAIRTATYRATLGLNIGSAVRNLTQGINTYAELGGRWTGTGYASVVRKMFNGGNTELEQVGVLDNSFIEDRTLSAKKKAIQKADKVLFSLFEKAEQINRGAAYYGAKQKAISEGKSTQQAIDAGVEAARKTQFTFGRVETPVALQGDINKLFTQFQSYNFKQAEFVGGMVSNKEYAKLTRYTVATLAVFALMSKALGYRPEDMLPFGSNVKDGKLPIATAPAFRVLPETIDFTKSVFSTPSENAKTDKATKIKEAGKDLGSAIGTVTIPGFVQAKKSYGGAKAYTEGEMERWGEGTVKIEQTPQNLAKGLVFGPYTMRTVDSPTQKTVKTNGEVVRPEGQIAITTKTEKDDSGKFVSRDKYDAVINAYTKADKTLDGGTTTSLGNIQKYDNEELSGAIKDIANEAVNYLEKQGITGIKADSKLAVLYAKYKKSEAQDPDKTFAQALVKAYPELKAEKSTSKKSSRKSSRSGRRSGNKTALKQAIAYATASTPSLPAFKLSGGQAPSAKLAIPSVRTASSSPKGRQYTVSVKKLA